MIRSMSSIGMILFVVIAVLAILFMVDASYAQEFDVSPEATEAPAIVDVTPVPEPPVVVVEAPQSPVSYEAILMFIGAVIAGIIWFANQANKRVERSVPVDLALVIADALVKMTPTTTDDELLERLKSLFTPAVEKKVDETLNAVLKDSAVG